MARRRYQAHNVIGEILAIPTGPMKISLGLNVNWKSFVTPRPDVRGA